MKRVSMLLLIIALVAMVAAPVMAQTTAPAELSPVVLQPFDASGAVGDPLMGVSLSLHVIPPNPQRPAQDWAARHFTLEIACVGAQFDQLKAGIGAAVNLASAEKINIKAGLVYLQSIKKPAVMLGLSIPL